MRSSSASPPEASFAAFLAESFAALRRDLPWIFERLCERLAHREIRIEVDGEALGLRCEPHDIHFVEAPPSPDVLLRTDRRTILDLVDAQRTLLEALLEERLVVLARVEDVIALHDAVQTYLHGAVRDRAFPALLRRFRQSTARAAGLA
ncbi:hypothetical protein [Polyangium sp. y55x31]|uniref:hypothetical protein n=1 Tax=Polyangium sp. y55x31 TaxID=3042688 RepID=UPI0024824D80|nr:hypothetical protein [Polyangium sp. y55x31]MDI1476488.1 hypothetical protein [Polyangium sp. y55x31]